MNDDTIDTTKSSSLEEVTGEPSKAPSSTDPAMAIAVSLANELQQVYADDQQKLEDMNRSLRSAFKGITKPKD